MYQNHKRQSRFSLQFSERKLLLLVVDLFILNSALLLMLSLWPKSVFNWMLGRIPWYMILLSIIWLVVSSFFSVYDLSRAASAINSVWSTGMAALITLIIYTLLPFLTPVLPKRRTQIFLLFLVGLAGISLWRFLYATIFSQPSFHHRALIVGAGRSGRTLLRAVQQSSSQIEDSYLGIGYEWLGFVDDDPAKQGQVIDGVPVLGTGRDLVALVKELDPDEIIIAVTDTQRLSSQFFRAILTCFEMGIHITTFPALYERLTGRVPVQHAGQDLSVLLPIHRPSGLRFYLAIRRLMDVAVAIPGLVLVVLLTPFIWLGNHLSRHPGPVFYRQFRMGENGSLFEIIKFRSMITDAERDTGAVWAQENDSRITPLGKYLRKTRLDELPQFWNVLKGEMSLIGPRPERPEIVADLSEEIPFYGLRHAVKPGITGWAQVSYRYTSSTEDSFVKLQYDLYYIKHLGPFIDLAVFLKTIQVILGMKGR
ncbi:MAG: sugar transferase [Gammaproteobacteria bacterium]|nr:sugar transferase [Gammaproteobacteria bacterium]